MTDKEKIIDIDFLYGFGSGAPDKSLMKIKIRGVNYAFIAGEIYNLNLNLDKDSKERKASLSKVYRVVEENYDTASARVVEMNKNLEEILCIEDEILGL